MIRASSAAKVCTNRPSFDTNAFNKDVEVLKDKVKAKKFDTFDLSNIKTYIETPGLKTIASAVEKHIINKELADNDPLPPGAKSHLKDLWLENNYGFVSFSLLEGKPGLLKGIYQEDNAIELLNTHLRKDYSKNTERKQKGFLTGECDIEYNLGIRDIKCPETWETFRNKVKIETTYHWQGIAYCYLYEKLNFSLDYVLMPVPEEPHIIEKFTRGYSDREAKKFFEMQDKIKSLPSSQRIKTFSIPQEVIKEDIKFLESRIKKCQEYYNTLTYEKCMNIYGN